jgi:very-short-patch-repair endonuclease
VIECDGSVHESNEQWNHDRTRDVYMVGQGLRVMRFTNEQVVNELDTVMEQIVIYLNKVKRRS